MSEQLTARIRYLSAAAMTSLFTLLLVSTAQAAVIGKPSNFLTTGQGLVGHWTFDGTDVNWNTGAVTDRSGNGNTGYLIGVMSTTTGPSQGRVGQALNFDGTDDYISVTTNISTLSNFSIAAWVYLDDDAGTDNPILETGDFDRIIIRPTAYYIGWDPENTVLSDSTPNNKNQWVHFVITKQGATTAIFRNGTFLNSGTLDDVAVNFATTRIGRQLFSGITNGKIDDYRIYNRVLRSDEIWRLYNIGATTKIGKSPVDTLTNGLVGYWTFDGPDTNWKTGAITDRSGQGNTAYVSQMATSSGVAAGRLGQGAQLDGVDEYITIANHSSLQPNHVSISAWFKLNSFPQSGNLVTKAFNAPPWEPPYLSWMMRINTLSLLEVDVGDGVSYSANAITLSTPLQVGRWYHLAMTYDGARLRTYLDGALIDTDTAISGNLGYGDTPVLIGADHGAAPAANFLAGVIDEVRIYNRALRSDEVLRLYHIDATAKIGTTPTDSLSSGLSGYWTFDGKDINWNTGVVSDKSGGGKIGYIQALSTTTSPIPGKLGQGLTFNGSASFINIPSSLHSTHGTICAWVKSGVDAAQTILAPDSGAGDNVFEFSVGDGATGFLSNELITIWRNGTDIVGYTTTNRKELFDNLWHHVCMTADGTRYKVYLDGVSKTITVGGGSDSGTFYDVGVTRAHIGHTPGASQFMNGSMDEVRIYNRALRADEIVKLYNLGL